MSVLRQAVILLCILGVPKADKVVMTNSGPVQGITVTSDGVDLEAFLGIPYAEPPVGRLRFMRPVPKTAWFGVYDASSLPPPCIQNATRKYYYAPVIDNMSEDCLYLNVWSPKGASGHKLNPVVLFIHGGAFNIGSSNMPVYDGAKLANYGDIVVVTINYRIGVMGFFAGFTDGAPGNMGMYDQVLAMNWMKANIKYFGGDPDHIVLMGESAGAMSVSGHLTSPLTKNLFKRAILQSGADISPIILDDNAKIYKTSQKLAVLVGCADKKVTLRTDPRLVVACLKRLTAEELSRAEGLMMINNPITFFPRIGDTYMPKASIYSFREGKTVDTDLLMGINRDEGTFFLSAAAPQYFGVYGVDNVKNVGRRLAYQMTRVIYKTLEQADESEIADFYINTIQNGTSDKYTHSIAQSIGDYMINCAVVFSADLNSLKGNAVYFYVFHKRPDSSPLASWMGTTHFDEIQYVFGNPLHKNFTQQEQQFSQRMMDRWIAFIKTGNPNVPDTIKWPMYSIDYPEYLEIDNEESVRLRPTNHRCEFWRDRFQTNIDMSSLERLRDAEGSANNMAPTFVIFLSIILQVIWISI